MNGTQQAERLHKEVVKQAIAEGKPVPQKVLDNYPDLQPANKAGAKIDTNHAKNVIKSTIKNLKEGTRRTPSGAYVAKQGQQQPITLADVQAAFKGQEVIQTDRGFIVNLKDGRGVIIEAVNQISPNRASLSIGYSKEHLSQNEVIAGKYSTGKIELVKGAADKWTLSHESVHWMEDLGIITPMESATLRRHIQNLIRDGKYQTVNTEDIGGSEDRANFIADALTRPTQGLLGRIINKIHDFVDKLVNLLVRTPRGIVRDIKTGGIFNERPALQNAMREEAYYNLKNNYRSFALPSTIGDVITSYFNINQVKNHQDYARAKAGDKESARRLIKSLVKDETVIEARSRFGKNAIYCYPHAIEAGGMNMIPAALANYYAKGGGNVGYLLQTNRAYHTGANAMERLISRVSFTGDIVEGGKYVLVDDVTTLGGTYAEMAHYIQQNGGQVVGIISLTNSSRMRNIIPRKSVIKEIERRYGNEIRQLFGVDPKALTAAEAGYLIGFRDADTLRNRATAAISERRQRLLSKGVRLKESLKTPQYSIRKQTDPPVSKDPKVLNLYLKDETDAITQTILNKLRPKIDKNLLLVVGSIRNVHLCVKRNLGTRYRACTKLTAPGKD